jgi:hypothetical protein
MQMTMPTKLTAGTRSRQESSHPLMVTIHSKHKHTKKIKMEGQTHLENLLTKSIELTAGTTKCIRCRKSKAKCHRGIQIQARERIRKEGRGRGGRPSYLHGAE